MEPLWEPIRDQSESRAAPSQIKPKQNQTTHLSGGVATCPFKAEQVRLIRDQGFWKSRPDGPELPVGPVALQGRDITTGETMLTVSISLAGG